MAYLNLLGINGLISLITEDPPAGGTDVDLQLLEASKAGDMEVVKVMPDPNYTFMYFCHKPEIYLPKELSTLKPEHTSNILTSPFYACRCVYNCWMSCKQCKPCVKPFIL